MLDIERFQTVFKNLARGKKHIMASIRNHYLLLETSLSNRFTRINCMNLVCNIRLSTSFRLKGGVEWNKSARSSTLAGFAAKADSADKHDAMITPLGAAKNTQLTMTELRSVSASHIHIYRRAANVTWLCNRFRTCGVQAAPSSRSSSASLTDAAPPFACGTECRTSSRWTLQRHTDKFCTRTV